MKITKEYLRQLIVESIEEEVKRYDRDGMVNNIKRFSKGVPSSGAHIPTFDDSEYGNDIPKPKVKIRKLVKLTGIKQTRAGISKTQLAHKGYYVEYNTGLGTEMTGPFETEEEAREYVKSVVNSGRNWANTLANSEDEV